MPIRMLKQSASVIGRLRLRLRLRKKESDLCSTLTSTSAYLLAAALPAVRRVLARRGGRVRTVACLSILLNVKCLDTMR
jgi:hypothetical protein